MEYDDFFSVGCEALWRASNTFKGKGKFASFAGLCIWRAVMDELKKKTRYRRLFKGRKEVEIDGIPALDKRNWQNFFVFGFLFFFFGIKYHDHVVFSKSLCKTTAYILI